MKQMINHAKIQFDSHGVNETFARTAVSGFLAPLDPTITQLNDVKTAVSEAVTNCIVHGYRQSNGVITLDLAIYQDRMLRVQVTDKGCGIADIPMAMNPLYTTGPEGERSGLGFSVMQSFMDRVQVTSRPGKGTRVTMHKALTPVDSIHSSNKKE